MLLTLEGVSPPGIRAAVIGTFNGGELTWCEAKPGKPGDAKLRN